MEILWSKRQNLLSAQQGCCRAAATSVSAIAQLSPAKLAPPMMRPCGRAITAASGRGIFGTGGFLRIIKGFANNRL
jgi:hypothetical protein